MKISSALYRAMASVGMDAEAASELADTLTTKVVKEIDKLFGGRIPTVEDVQDVVEQVLIREGLDKVAKAYILYRERHAELRYLKHFIGVRDDLKLSVNAVEVLKRRYLLRNSRGEVVESPMQMLKRVASAIARAELGYGKSMDEVNEIERGFLRLMRNLEFLPNSPTLMNAGTELGQLAACFVLPIADSMVSIFDAVKNAALIHQSGGGTGFSFSRLRPRGDVVRSTGGIASGPVSFMRVFDVATEVIKQGGKRRGANMGVLRVDHPDIKEFIRAKESGGFPNFNISVAVTDAFMHAVERDEDYGLVNPRTNEEVKRINAREVFNELVTYAWKTGDPGIIFIDEINRHNPTPAAGEIEATNPCGEQPLLAYESCNLGSINLAKFAKSGDGEIEWDRLREAIRLCVRFLDDVIDVNKYPLPEIERITKANRKIGLGVMGFADLLIKLGIAYDSKDALSLAEKLMRFITEEARLCSVELGRERGSFPNFELSVWNAKYDAMRNATVTTVAPTGTIGIIANCSSGIEPIFAVAFVRNVMGGMLEINPVFEAIAKERGFYSKELITAIAKRGSVQDIEGVPADVRRVFVTALDISPEWHVRMQAAFQRYTDNAVSKTVNLPADAPWQAVKRVFSLAYELKCKGVTVYRYGCKEAVLSPGIPKLMLEEYVRADTEYTGECRICSV